MASRLNKIKHRRKRHMPKPYEVATIAVFLFLVSFLGFILAACVRTPDRTSMAYTYAMQTRQAIEAMTPTPTPFQPNLAARNEQLTPEPGTQTGSGSLNTRTFQKPYGQVNILLLGSDSRPDSRGFRTDSISWVSLNPRDGYVSIISFPRDMYVDIPGMASNRINVPFGRGGFDLLADTFELNFGVRPDHYILVEFDTFTTLINNLGGINVQAARNLTDSCARWVNPTGECSVGPGLVHMDGDTALWYVRSRYSSNDIDRARRAQEVIEATFKRLMSLDALLMVPDLYNVYRNSVQTDLKLGDVLPLIPLASRIYEEGDIRNYVIGFDQVYSWRTAAGAQVLVPNVELVQEVLIEAMDLR